MLYPKFIKSNSYVSSSNGEEVNPEEVKQPVMEESVNLQTLTQSPISPESSSVPMSTELSSMAEQLRRYQLYLQLNGNKLRQNSAVQAVMEESVNAQTLIQPPMSTEMSTVAIRHNEMYRLQHAQQLFAQQFPLLQAYAGVMPIPQVSNGKGKKRQRSLENDNQPLNLSMKENSEVNEENSKVAEKVKIYKKYTPEQLQKAMKLVTSGQCKIKVAAARYPIPIRTLYDKINQQKKEALKLKALQGEPQKFTH